MFELTKKSNRTLIADISIVTTEKKASTLDNR